MKYFLRRIKNLKFLIFIFILLFAFRNIVDTFQDLEYLNNHTLTTPLEYRQDFISALYANKSKNLVNVLDLGRTLEPTGLYDSIKCRQSIKLKVQTLLCIHDLKSDVHVSGSIWKNGIWEQHILELFLEYLNEETFVLDIGAHIGVYTLFAAKMGRHVISVEPFYDNVLRIHKSVRIQNLQNKITLISNGISNRRNETKRLTKEDENIGGQSLMIFKNEQVKETKKDKYHVDTILFDDLLDYVPRKANGEKYKKVVMKIDIEGFEIYAFQNASRLFETLDIRVVFMEWGNFPKLIYQSELVEKLIEFFSKRNYTPYPIHEPFTRWNSINNFLNMFRSKKSLPLRFWEYWTWDIMWVKG